MDVIRKASEKNKIEKAILDAKQGVTVIMGEPIKLPPVSKSPPSNASRTSVTPNSAFEQPSIGLKVRKIRENQTFHKDTYYTPKDIDKKRKEIEKRKPLDENLTPK